MTDTATPITPPSSPPAEPAAALARHSRGELAFSSLSGKTFITRQMAQSPMKILAPRHAGRAASAFISTFGGGLVAGDHLSLAVELDTASRAVLSTQSTTKVYRSMNNLGCAQDLIATLAPQSILMLLPDPIMCFAGARYRQRQRFYLPSDDAGLCLIDGLVSGRRARGECWAFDRYVSYNDIYRGDKPILRDALRLTSHEGPLARPNRLGRYHCLATLVLLGAPMRAIAADILAQLAHQPIVRNASLVAAASPLADGAIIRIAGTDTQQIAQQLRTWCRSLCDLIGDDPWARKW